MAAVCLVSYIQGRHFKYGLGGNALPSSYLLSPSLPPLPLPFPFALHLPPLRSRPLIIRLGSLGSTLAPPAGPGSAKLYLANFRLKISLLVATIFRSFSGNETPNWGGGGAERPTSS